MLRELNLSPLNFARVFRRASAFDLLEPLAQLELFGPDRRRGCSLIIQASIDHRLRECPSVDHRWLDLIETFSLASAGTAVVGEAIHKTDALCSSSGGKPDSRLYMDLDLSEVVEEVLVDWAFDLDTLRPDGGISEETKFRSPLGWLDEGSIIDKDQYYSSNHISMMPIDPYKLLYGAKKVEAEKMLFIVPSIPSRYLPKNSDTTEADIMTCQSIPSKKSKTETKGWKRIGRIDCATGTIDTTAQESEEERSFDADSDDKIKKTTSNQSASLTHLTTCISVNRFFCGDGNKCEEHSEQRKVESVTRLLCEHLDNNSPAMRDVILAHVLVNGNVELAQRLMTGAYCCYPKYDSEANTSMQCPHTLMKVKARPVLPTLAHLRIIQKLDRRPLKVYVDCILDGAPFKQGYVKSSLHVPEEMENIDKRRVSYREQGHRDDGPVMELYREKSRLEGIDAGSGELEHSAGEVGESESTLATRYHEAEAVDMTEDLSNAKQHFQVDDINYTMTVAELIRRSKSLDLWKQHLCLLQWFEKRKEIGETFEDDEAASRNGHCSQKSFSAGLDDMLIKVTALHVAMQKQISALEHKLTASGDEMRSKDEVDAKRKRSAPMRSDTMTQSARDEFALLMSDRKKLRQN